jgi:hypothetical protein
MIQDLEIEIHIYTQENWQRFLVAQKEKIEKEIERRIRNNQIPEQRR